MQGVIRQSTILGPLVELEFVAIGSVHRGVCAPRLARHVGGRRASGTQLFNRRRHIVGSVRQECTIAGLLSERLGQGKHNGRLCTGRLDFQSTRTVTHVCVHDHVEAKNVSVELQRGVLVADLDDARSY